MKDSNAYLDLIIAACKKVTEYVHGLDEVAFLKQSMAQSAVIMQLQVIGEVAKKLDESVRNEIDAPWSMIIGLRNIISHDYFLLELGTIWDIASINVPALEAGLHRYLEAHGTSYVPPFDDMTPLLP
jgi:uncharacterized protein with HEPN domain